MLDLVIIGAGPAGLTAAIYAARAQMNAVIIENHIAGGQIATTGAVDNYPGMPGVQGLVMAEQFRTHAEQMGAHFQRGQVTGIENSGTVKKILLADGEPLTTKAVIAATGAAPRSLGMPGEEALRGNGVSYCAMCDGAFFYGKRVCVVGGGDTAVEDAFSLSRQASEVILIHRRDSLRAQKAQAARDSQRFRAVECSRDRNPVGGRKGFRRARTRRKESQGRNIASGRRVYRGRNGSRNGVPAASGNRRRVRLCAGR